MLDHCLSLQCHTVRSHITRSCPSPLGDFQRVHLVTLSLFIFFFFSDGAGRSGVYLAIDANIELSEEDGVFDVYGYLVKMRQQRRGLVETLVSSIAFSFCFLSLPCLYGNLE